SPAGDAVLHRRQHAGRGRRSDPLPAPVLAVRPPGGLHPHPAGLGDRGRPAVVLRAQAGVRLSGDRRRAVWRGAPVDGRLRAPHVHHRDEPAARRELHAAHHDHLGADRAHRPQLAGDALAGRHPLPDADAVLSRPGLHLRRGRADRPLPGRHHRRPLPARHLLRGRPLPPHHGGGAADVALRRDVLLVPQDVRPDDERGARQAALLAHLRPAEPGLLRDAGDRLRGDGAAALRPVGVRLPEAALAAQPRHLARRLPAGRRAAGLRAELLLEPGPRPARRRQPLGGGDAGVVGRLAAPAPQLRSDPDRRARPARARPPGRAPARTRLAVADRARRRDAARGPALSGDRMTAVPAAARRREVDAQVGLVIFLGATAMLFAALLLAYAIVRAQAPAWPPAGAPPFPRGAAAVNTFALVAASIALRRGRPGLALGLGAAFLAAQGLLWQHLVAIHLGPTAGALGEVFFALSVLHA